MPPPHLGFKTGLHLIEGLRRALVRKQPEDLVRLCPGKDFCRLQEHTVDRFFDDQPRSIVPAVAPSDGLGQITCPFGKITIVSLFAWVIGDISQDMTAAG